MPTNSPLVAATADLTACARASAGGRVSSLEPAGQRHTRERTSRAAPQRRRASSQSREPSRCTSIRNERVASTGASWLRLAARAAPGADGPCAADGGDGDHAGGEGRRGDGRGLLDHDHAGGGVGALQRPRLIGQDRDGVDLFDAVGLVLCLHSGR
jgi:hypothetical protein